MPAQHSRNKQNERFRHGRYRPDNDRRVNRPVPGSAPGPFPCDNRRGRAVLRLEEAPRRRTGQINDGVPGEPAAESFFLMP